MKRLVGAFLCLIASHARADMVAEYRVTANMMMMERADLNVRVVVRKDRSRVEYWSATPGGKQVGKIEITRSDRHLRWSIYPGDRTYIEAIWPDPPPPGMDKLKNKIGVDAAMPDSVRDRMRAMEDQAVEVRHLERDTINGFPAEHYAVTSHPRAPIAGFSKGMTVGGSHDLWILTSHPRLDEAIHLFEVLGQHRKLSNYIFASMDEDLPSDMPSPPDSVRGIPLRAVMRMQMFDSTGIAEMAKAPPDTAFESSLQGMFDPKTGTMLLSDFEMTSLRFDTVPDEEFELPAGYKNLSAPEPAEATPRRRTRR